MTQRKSICILARSPIHTDARVQRQVDYLAREFDITLIANGQLPPAWQGSPHIRWLNLQAEPVRESRASRLKQAIPSAMRAAYWSTRRRLVRMGQVLDLATVGKLNPAAHETWYWRNAARLRMLQLAAASGCDAFHANNWDMLGVAAKAAQTNGARIVLDAHEYGPLQYDNVLYFRLVTAPICRYILRTYGPQVDAMTTVSTVFVERYAQEFGFKSIVVLNAPARPAVLPTLPAHDDIRLVHHGLSAPERRLENMIETLAHCDRRYSLHFMLVDRAPDYTRRLRTLAERRAPGRVVFHEPVPVDHVVCALAKRETTPRQMNLY